VLVRYAVRFYEHTSFFGHESDADVVITPAMALIIPGLVPGAKIVGTEHEPDIEPELGPEDEHPPRSALDASADEWMFASELPLGPSGAVRVPRPETRPAAKLDTGPETQPAPPAESHPETAP
jgi:hypothetical protein